jgi:hypothetical protein
MTVAVMRPILAALGRHTKAAEASEDAAGRAALRLISFGPSDPIWRTPITSQCQSTCRPRRPPCRGDGPTTPRWQQRRFGSIFLR